MFSTILAVVALFATFLQTVTSGREVGRANRAAVEWWNTEDEIVAEERSWRRRWITRRELRSWRDQETAKAIRHVQTVLISWMLLLAVAIAALGNALWNWLSGL